jgi:TonB family protein
MSPSGRRHRNSVLGLFLCSCLLLIVYFFPEQLFAGCGGKSSKVKRVRTGGYYNFFPKLVYKVKPVYPQLALDAKIEGTVILEILISPEGFVTKARVVSGHPLIVDAARKAVLQWRYAPPRFKDEPVEVITQTSVTFTLPPADTTPKEITTASD